LRLVLKRFSNAITSGANEAAFKVRPALSAGNSNSLAHQNHHSYVQGLKANEPRLCKNSFFSV
jgi:hypothetical protein